jgi:hypothetical protein
MVKFDRSSVRDDNSENLQDREWDNLHSGLREGLRFAMRNCTCIKISKLSALNSTGSGVRGLSHPLRDKACPSKVDIFIRRMSLSLGHHTVSYRLAAGSPAFYSGSSGELVEDG